MSEQVFLDRLRRHLVRRVDDFGGVAGVAVLDLKSGARVGINEDITFPAASTIKIHLIAALFDLHERGEVNVDERVRVTSNVPGSGVLAYLDDVVELTWRDLANLMILVSDNSATNMIMGHIGLDRMADYLAAWGLGETRIVRVMQDHEASANGMENISTPNDMVTALQLLWNGDVMDRTVASEVLRVLRKPKVTPFSHGLPKGAPLADKSGGMDRVRSDVGIVELQARPFAMAVFTNYGSAGPQQQMEWVANTGRVIYDAMLVLNETSVYGQGIVATRSSSV